MAILFNSELFCIFADSENLATMIKYQQKRLANGLTILVNRDSASKLAAVNILYCVGARNEAEDKTGFAHLFEHLMFRGTHLVPDFDIPVQMAAVAVVSLPLFLVFIFFRKYIMKGVSRSGIKG